MAIFGKKKEEEEKGIPPRMSPLPSPSIPSKPSSPVPPRSPASSPPDPRDKNMTYLGKNLKIKGSVVGDGDFMIMGSFEGDFDLKGRLKIVQPAQVKGNVTANTISVNGNVEGTLTAKESLHLDNTANIKGRINTPRISVTEGALFEGEINMSQSVQPSVKPAGPEPKQTPSAPGKK